jgi:tRNA(Ile)-lysidine synthetase-like protein
MNIRTLRQKIFHKNKDFLQSLPMVALGMSGGIDSTALFHVFLHFHKLKYFSNFVVLHMNFGLRGRSSDLDERFVERLCQEHNIPFYSKKPAKKPTKPGGSSKGESPDSGIQEWARDARHKWFKQFAKKGFTVALAHNQNDLAENYLFRLIRGGQPENLAGMSIHDSYIWRPFIDIPRFDIVEVMAIEKLPWREDKSNKSTKYSRNRIRLDVIPALEQISKAAVAKIARHARELQLKETVNRQTHTIELESVTLAQGDGLSQLKINDIQRFLESAQPDQSIDLGRGFVLSKRRVEPENIKRPSKSQAHQHSMALDGVEMRLMLPEHDSFLIASPAHERLLFENKPNWIQTPELPADSSIIHIYPPSSNCKVTIAESGRTFKFKELMQKWNVDPADRNQFFVIELADGRKILKSIVNRKMKQRD